MPESTVTKLPPLTIVLLGGIASGKSTVAGLLAQRGAVVLDADRIAHEELLAPEVVSTVREAWGERVLTDGAVDRRKLGDVVFQDPVELKRLEEILHPRVLQRIEARVKELSAAAGDDRKVVVLDVPLASETAVARTADLRLFVEASVEVREKRARERRGWSPGELERRERRQLSVAEKQAMADAVVRNDAGIPEAERDVQRFWSSLVEPRLQEQRRE